MNKEKLLKLADHLEGGELGHEEFDFSRWNSGPKENDYKVLAYECGYAGCAIGECPVVWPRDWCFDEAGDPVLIHRIKKGVVNLPSQSAKHWFKIDSPQMTHLFCPGAQNVTAFGGEKLTYKATKEQVASNIRAFVKKMEEE